MPRMKTTCESRMREIRMSGLTRGGAGSGHWLYASHPVPPLLLYICLDLPGLGMVQARPDRGPVSQKMLRMVGLSRIWPDLLGLEGQVGAARRGQL
jgi:hypothetical protein